MKNIPEVKLGIIVVSRGGFSTSLSQGRREAVVTAYRKKGLEVFESPVIVENEVQMLEAVEGVKAAGCNALTVYLGNFGPETPETLIAQYFDGPVMYVAAEEETTGQLDDGNGRGDAYCGMLNASYNLALRNLKAYIPEDPCCSAEEVADRMEEFLPIARTILGLKKLKIITFGPRPQDFMACNAPIKQLHNIGVEIEENSELDLWLAFVAHENDYRIPDLVKEIEAELGSSNSVSQVVPKLAQFELTLLDWAEEHKGAREYVVFANKCWPSFKKQFGFAPCYVNGRMAAKGMPVACEVDIYGALSEYIATCLSQDAVSILDINNTVPMDMYQEQIQGKYPYGYKEVFMGFHCGNAPVCKMAKFNLTSQKVRVKGPAYDYLVSISAGALDGDYAASDITLFRLQSTADGQLRSYVAQGEILPVECHSYGSIGVCAIPEMGRFYRHVLIERNYPHHAAVAFGHFGKEVVDVFRYLGVEEIMFNQPKELPYPSENPFVWAKNRK